MLASMRDHVDLRVGLILFDSTVCRFYGAEMIFVGGKEVTDRPSIIGQHVLRPGVIGYFSPTPPNEIRMQLMGKELKHK